MIEARIDSAPARAALAQWRHAFAARLAGVFADGAAALLESARAKLSGSVLASGSGRLRASLRAEVTSKAGGFAARVWSDGSVPYARIQEYGGRIAVPEIRAIETKALAFAYGGRLVFTRMTRAHAVDIPERSFLRSALAEFAPAFAEAIYAALFALVSGAWAFTTTTRRIREYADVDQATQPALLQVELGERWNARAGAPPAITLAARLFLYCESNDPTEAVSTQMNTLLDAVTAALAPPLLPHGPFRQTLGGLVQHAGVAGEITIAEGLSGQSEAVIPIEILVNN